MKQSDDESGADGPGVQPGGGAAQAEGESQADSADLKEELSRLTASYQRLAADFENFRRRKAQEGLDLSRYGGAPVLTALLPGLDNLARALEHLPDDADDGLASGLRLTLRQIEEALASQGVTKIQAAGQPFDPALHDAVAVVDGNGQAAGTVVAELQPGYLLHDRVIRPAQVSVARQQEDEADQGGQESGQDGVEE